ncbi:LPO_1073/Vpar_1526 family protein [Oceanimonas smirnovii]|uniref:LPO_1073/Vpar_1526 family protein n=1 Tax=Oceanimonas smirnovii TaxID=264574 RepID=UPI003FD612DB
MINDQVQKQQGGNSSTNLQGQSIVINQGISYSDARDIALDVYKSNFLQLSNDAAELARSRAEELTDSFLTKLKETNELAIEQMKQPAMQAALYEAQKQYAKSGDEEMEYMLVDMLVQRASTPERNTKQIVLDEALEVVSKLTNEQLNILSLNFGLTRLSRNSIRNLDDLIKYINNELLVFVNPNSDYHASWFEHLAYSGCVVLLDASWYKDIPELLLRQYPAMFQKGFDEKELEDFVGKPISQFHTLLMQCFHTVNLYQFNLMNENLLVDKANELGIESELSNKLKQYFNSRLMNINEVKEWLLEAMPDIGFLLDNWGGENNQLSKLQLTSVGIALAQANYKQKVTNIDFDLGVWIK